MRKVKSVIEITDETFSEIINKNTIVVIDCWAEWCGPCKMFAPTFDELSKSYAGKIVFCKMNVDENQRIPSEYGIMSIPTLMIFKNGKLVDTLIGVMPKKTLESHLKKYLST